MTKIVNLYETEDAYDNFIQELSENIDKALFVVTKENETFFGLKNLTGTDLITAIYRLQIYAQDILRAAEITQQLEET